MPCFYFNIPNSTSVFCFCGLEAKMTTYGLTDREVEMEAKKHMFMSTHLWHKQTNL